MLRFQECLLIPVNLTHSIAKAPAPNLSNGGPQGRIILFRESSVFSTAEGRSLSGQVWQNFAKTLGGQSGQQVVKMAGRLEAGVRTKLPHDM